MCFVIKAHGMQQQLNLLQGLGNYSVLQDKLDGKERRIQFGEGVQVDIMVRHPQGRKQICACNKKVNVTMTISPS